MANPITTLTIGVNQDIPWKSHSVGVFKSMFVCSQWKIAFLFRFLDLVQMVGITADFMTLIYSILNSKWMFSRGIVIMIIITLNYWTT